MLKKSRGKRREIRQLSVQKRKNIRARLETFRSTEKSFSAYEKRLSRLSQIVWSHLGRLCTELNLVPFHIDPDSGLWIQLPTHRIIIHYVLTALTLTVLLRNFILSQAFRAGDGLNPAEVWTLGFFLFSFSCVAGWIGSSFTTKEMMDLMNSWQIHLQWLEEETGNKLSIFGSTCDNIKLNSTSWLFHVIPIEMTLGSVIIGGIPATFYGLIESVIFGPGNLPWVWRTLLWPLELLMYLPPATVAAFNAACMTLSYRLLRIYCDEMR